MGLANSIARFNRQRARQRQTCWPVTLTASDFHSGGRPLDATKSATHLGRRLNDQGTGWVQSALATFSFAAAGAYLPEIGSEFTLTKYAVASEVRTIWRCFDLIRS